MLRYLYNMCVVCFLGVFFLTTMWVLECVGKVKIRVDGGGGEVLSPLAEAKARRRQAPLRKLLLSCSDGRINAHMHTVW